MSPAAKTTRKQPDPGAAENPIVVATAAPRFDFDLAPDRETLKVGGKLYEIKRLDDFGIGRQRRLDRDGREFAQLWNKAEELTDDEDVRLKFLLDRIFEDLLDAPEDVRGSFSDSQKAKVVLDFSLAPLRELLAENLRQAMKENEAGNQASTTTT